jgi:hypothetical protein
VAPRHLRDHRAIRKALGENGALLLQLPKNEVVDEIKHMGAKGKARRKEGKVAPLGKKGEPS